MNIDSLTKIIGRHLDPVYVFQTFPPGFVYEICDTKSVSFDCSAHFTKNFVEF